MKPKHDKQGEKNDENRDFLLVFNKVNSLNIFLAYPLPLSGSKMAYYFDSQRKKYEGRSATGGII